MTTPTLCIEFRDGLSPTFEELTSLVQRLTEKLSAQFLRGILQEFLEVFRAPGDLLRTTECDGGAAAWTTCLTLGPSERLLELLAALRAFDGELDRHVALLEKALTACQGGTDSCADEQAGCEVGS